MTKTIKELAEEYDSIEVETINFDCYNCGNPELEVHFHEDDYTRSWPYCPSCGSRENYVLSGLDQRGVDIIDE